MAAWIMFLANPRHIDSSVEYRLISIRYVSMPWVMHGMDGSSFNLPFNSSSHPTHAIIQYQLVRLARFIHLHASTILRLYDSTLVSHSRLIRLNAFIRLIHCC